jgi:hypothetical protein
MGKLSQKLMCDDPLISELSPEQVWALHEFFHVLIAAGYNLYRFVPYEYADRVIKEKFGLVIPKPPPDPPDPPKRARRR